MNDSSFERRLAAYFDDERRTLHAPDALWGLVSSRLGQQARGPMWRRLFVHTPGSLRLAVTGAAMGVVVLLGVVWQLQPFGGSSNPAAGRTGPAGPSRPAGPAGPTGPGGLARAPASGVTNPGLSWSPPGVAATAVPSTAPRTVFLAPSLQGTPAPGARISRDEAIKVVEANVPQGGYGISKEQYEVLVQKAMSGELGRPTDQPLDLTFFQNYGVNPFVAATEQPFSTFAIDVDTASYTIARAYINSGRLPPPDAVRVEEFVNYFEQGYPAARETFAIHVDGARSPFAGDGRHLLRVGISGRDVSLDDRRDAVITFVIDTSGSMSQEDRLELVKRSLNLLLDRLRPGDRIGVVEYDNTARLLLEPTADKEAVRAAVRRLVADGSTNAEDGLRLGYSMATRAFEDGKINRVILVSDGVANTGQTDPAAILDQIKESSRAGITLSAIGVGMANYNDVLLEKLADHGDGNYAYIDTDEEAARLFGDGLTGLLEVIASDAKIQVEFEPASVEMYRLVGYENRGIAAEQFRDDLVDAGEVGAGHTVTALYELRLKKGVTGSLGTVRVRYADVATGKVSEIERKVTVREIDGDFMSAPARLRFTASVGAFAEVLRRSPWATGLPLSLIAMNAEDALKGEAASASDKEFIALVNQAIALSDGLQRIYGDDRLCPQGLRWLPSSPSGQAACVAPTPGGGR